MNLADRAHPSLRVGAAGLVALMVLTGCGSTSTKVTGAPSLTAYLDCLEQHGGTPRTLATAEPTPAAKPVSAKAVRKARKACAPLRPPGLALHAGGLSASSRKSFGKCMADHGVPLPTPTAAPIPSESAAPDAPRGGMLSGLDRKDPRTAAALDACRGLLLTPSAGAAPSVGP